LAASEPVVFVLQLHQFRHLCHAPVWQQFFAVAALAAVAAGAHLRMQVFEASEHVRGSVGVSARAHFVPIITAATTTTAAAAAAVVSTNYRPARFLQLGVERRVFGGGLGGLKLHVQAGRVQQAHVALQTFVELRPL